MNYEQALSWADDIPPITADGTMPPWKPVDGTVNSATTGPERRREAEIASGSWTAARKAPLKICRAAPVSSKAGGWRARPDSFAQRGLSSRRDGRDVYRCFVLPDHFDRDKYVVALEVLPGNPRVVHHVIAYLDTSGRAQRFESKGRGQATPLRKAPPASSRSAVWELGSGQRRRTARRRHGQNAAPGAMVVMQVQLS